LSAAAKRHQCAGAGRSGRAPKFTSYDEVSGRIWWHETQRGGIDL